MGYSWEYNTLTFMIGFPCRTYVASQDALGIELGDLLHERQMIGQLSYWDRCYNKWFGLYSCYMCVCWSIVASTP